MKSGATVLAATTAALAVALVMPATSSAGLRHSFFHTLDGNISCAVFKDVKARRRHGRKLPGSPGSARCDLRQHTWTAPPRPRWCPGFVDWGFGTEVGRRGPGHYVCAGDTVEDPSAPAFGPGSTVTVGRYTCAVLTTSVRCTNNVTLHGFEVSAASVSLF
jgi:uncharacterized protein DUF6636